ncbi:hypothetical protein WR25_15170 [Diploscapter pachys]|uniref:Serpentine receptor class gamma n=1 Tax=Diploscapter pachys TaxID=2018661 RepID=A0A2A2KNX4_9BILA|nr:hypothetical protein WR25_15170 [Diploscapter pachys]
MLFTPCLFSWHILFSQSYWSPLDGRGFAMDYTKNITWMSNSRSVMIVSTFTMVMGAIFCVATIHRIRFIPSGAMRIAEKRLILITTVMTTSLLGQFMVATCFQFNRMLWEFRKETYNWLFVMRPFAADISNLAPAWIIHFLDKNIAYNKENSSQNSSKMLVRHANVR